MRLTDKTESWSFGCKHLEGKYKGFKCTISFSSQHYSNVPHWYYVFTNTKTDKIYNSLWDNLKFETQEECHNACVEKINQVLKELKQNG